MHFEWFVSLRYLKAKRKKGFISLITVISVVGVAVGVMALICVLGVMTGFTEEFRAKILGVNSHIVIQKYGAAITDYAALRDRLLARPAVIGATPYLYTQAMITAGEGGTGAILRGIDPATAPSVIALGDHLLKGRLADLDSTSGKVPGIIVGSELAKQLHLRMGDRVRLISPAGPLTPIGVIPRMKPCEVVGIFETGIFEYDSTLAYVSLATARVFLDLDEGVHGIELRLTDIYQADKIARDIERELGVSFVAKDWIKLNRNLFSALRLEKTALSIIVALIVLVAAFNIVSTLIMVVMEKSRDIAILKSMGATSGSIMRIFIYEGLVIGLTGTLLGVLGGLGLSELLSRYQFIKLPDVYPMTTLPVQVLPLDVAMIAGAAVIITFVATLYPSWQASRVEPAEALRYE
ncbi:MAG: lipoprotein-releasing ABC transporter permease subunit [Desulfurivibrionaceae bacterium]|nr:lipoprotein-releasing ABC transporter permease subunit [Desulfobulbales bacterium]MDT8334764.1 lipoprotein-releasing ABC transporter permease subunit [Desulfurivibrionaceae bacterium]